MNDYNMKFNFFHLTERNCDDKWFTEARGKVKEGIIDSYGNLKSTIEFTEQQYAVIPYLKVHS